VDTLALRGYVTRDVDLKGRRVSLILKERGRAAANAVFEGTRIVDEELSRRLSAAEIAGLRLGLVALGEIKQSREKL